MSYSSNNKPVVVVDAFLLSQQQQQQQQQRRTAARQQRQRQRQPLLLLKNSLLEEIPITSTTSIQICHQLFLGDVVQGDGDMTGLKLWKTVPIPMIQYMLLQKDNYFSSSSSSHDGRRPLTILELGSGCGLLGLGLAAVLPNCKVILTDAEVNFVVKANNQNEELQSWTSLTWLEQNIQYNQNNVFVQQQQQQQQQQNRVSVQPLYWGNPQHIQSILQATSASSSPIDVIVGSELLYNNQAAFPGLLDTLLAFSNQNNNLLILLGYKVRGLGESKFFDMAQEYFDITYTDLDGRRPQYHLSSSSSSSSITSNGNQNNDNNSKQQYKRKRKQKQQYGSDKIRLAELRYKNR